MSNDDLVRLQHMLDAAEEAVSFAQGQTRNENPLRLRIFA